MTNPSTTMIRGETSDCSNPKLDVFFTIGGIAVDVSVLEFQIFDVTDELNPIQVFPTVLGNREPVAIGVVCPAVGAGKISVGHFVATYTVDNAEALGPHEIRWFYKQLPTSPEETFSEQFEIALLTAGGSLDPQSVAAFKKRFPAFADVDSELIQCVLEEAACEVDQECFGEKYTSALNYFAAHLLSVATGGARAKGATAVSAGMASITYGQAKADFTSSAYGLRYISLARQCCGMATLAPGPC